MPQSFDGADAKRASLYGLCPTDAGLGLLRFLGIRYWLTVSLVAGIARPARRGINLERL